MSKKLQLSIPKPCHEDWEAMTPEEKGRFCGSCQKQVVDFSVMSDRQIAEFFKKPSTGSVCGRFMTDQLERDIDIPRKRIPWLKYFFQFTLPAFLVSLKATSGKAQIGKIKVESVARDTTKPVCRPTMGIVARPTEPAQQGLKGNVVDASTKLALPLAKIILVTSAGNETVKVNSDGSFVINYVRKSSISAIEFSLAGYQSRSVSWLEFLGTLNGDLHTIKLQREMTLKGEIAVNTCRKPLMGDIMVVPYSNHTKPVAPAPQDIKGIVVDENNNPVPYASILSGNPLSFIIAGENGEFVIPGRSIPTDSILNFSAAGYENAQAVIRANSGGGEKMKIVLKNKVLDEVVVTAGQQVMMKGIMGAVARISAEKTALSGKENQPAVTIEQKIQPSGMSIFPNPLPGGTELTIEWKEKDAGYFLLQLTDLSGRLVHQREIWIDRDARLLHIDLPVTASGNYVLTLINRSTGKSYAAKLLRE